MILPPDLHVLAFLCIFLFTSGTSADDPTVTPAPALEPRQDPPPPAFTTYGDTEPLAYYQNVLACEHPNYSHNAVTQQPNGNCQLFEADANFCFTVPDGWMNKISSFKPSDRAGLCVVYKDVACKGDTILSSAANPQPDLMQVLGWDNAIMSWQCGKDASNPYDIHASCTNSPRGAFNWFEIRGNHFAASTNHFNFADGDGLKNLMDDCGTLTTWEFRYTPKDCCYQFYAAFALPSRSGAHPSGKCVADKLKSIGVPNADLRGTCNQGD